jgi:hypothetical protein
MPDLELKYSSDPTGDISSRPVKCYFGQRAIEETVAVNKISSTGMYNTVNKGSYLGRKTIDGIDTCLGVTINYTLLSQQVHYIDPLNFSYAAGARSSVTYIPGEMIVKISWDAKIPEMGEVKSGSTPSTSTPGEAIPDNSTVDRIVIIKNGFSLKCRNIKDIRTYGNGEIRSESNYSNNLIPDMTHGERIGKNLILNSMKNLNIAVNTVPNFGIKLRQYVRVPVSYLFYSENLKVEGLEFSNNGADQAFIIHTRGRQY